MTAIEEGFLDGLAEAILAGAGSAHYTKEAARRLAEEVVGKMRELGPYAYPNLVDLDDTRFVYQWDEQPPILTVMRWNDVMWVDMVRLTVPEGILP